jgi:hypothetical protein
MPRQCTDAPSPGSAFAALMPRHPLPRGEAEAPVDSFVIAGLDPAIQAEPPHLRACRMDARVEPAHDEKRNAVSKNLCWCGYPPPQPSPSRGEGEELATANQESWQQRSRKGELAAAIQERACPPTAPAPARRRACRQPACRCVGRHRLRRRAPRRIRRSPRRCRQGRRAP